MEMNLIDLISEKHSQVRQRAADRWKETQAQEISRTEEHILNRAARREMSLSEMARETGLSRQAVHKCALRLEERDYLQMARKGDNRKEKILLLSKKGTEYYLTNQNMKKELEKEMGEKLGEERVRTLKALLREDWW